MNSQGCGLGLIISNSLAKGLNKTCKDGIKVESTYGKGSKFYFKIENLKKEID